MSNTERLRHRWAKCTVPHPKDAENKAAMYFCVQCGMVKQSVWLDKIRQYSRDDYRRGDFFQSAREPKPAPPCPHVFLPPTINGFTITRDRSDAALAEFGMISATVNFREQPRLYTQAEVDQMFVSEEENRRYDRDFSL